MQKLEDSLKYREWTQALEKNGVDLRHVEDLYTVRKGGGDVLFSLVKIDAIDPEGNPILPIALLRGAFVSILTCLIDEETKERFLLLVKQRRVGNGAEFLEHPAGMMDSESDPFVVAIQELREETGLKINKEELRLLNEEMIYSSPGLQDEGGFFMFCEKEMSRSEIMSFHNKKQEGAGHGEFITTYISTISESKVLIKNGIGLLNLYLYLAHKD